MSLLPAVARVGAWFRKIAPRRPQSLGPRETLAIELSGTIGITRAADDCIEASIAGRIHQRSRATPGLREDATRRPQLDSTSHPVVARVEARRRSSRALANADPFVWLQLFDDRGALTHETFLGRGVGIEYKVRAQIEVPTFEEPVGAVDFGDPLRRRSRSRLASGLHARVVTRTYANPVSPGHHMEVLALLLLAAGTALPLHALPKVPALTIVPSLDRASTREPSANGSRAAG